MFVANGELLEMQKGLPELAKLDVPSKVGYYVAKLVRVLSAEIKDISDAQNKLVTKYGEDLGGGRFSITSPINTEGKPGSPNWEVFEKERQELLEAESDIEFKTVVLPAEIYVPIPLLMMFDRWLTVEGIEA